jgi:hypothetical protein
MANPLAADWTELGNQAQIEAELHGLRQSVMRGWLFGDEGWVEARAGRYLGVARVSGSGYTNNILAHNEREDTMITHLPGMSLPTECTLDITIRVTQPLNITSFSARQRVTQYVVSELSSQLGGDTPELTVGERIYWSVPVLFTLPGRGVLGRVGMLRVDAGTGELLTDPQTEQEMLRHAEQLAQRTTLPAGT